MLDDELNEFFLVQSQGHLKRRLLMRKSETETAMDKTYHQGLRVLFQFKRFANIVRRDVHIQIHGIECKFGVQGIDQKSFCCGGTKATTSR